MTVLSQSETAKLLGITNARSGELFEEAHTQMLSLMQEANMEEFIDV